MRGFFLAFIIFIGYIYAQNNNVHPDLLHDQLRNNAAKRLVNMSYELVIEAKLLQRQMQPTLDFYLGQVTYEIGYVMGKIRERYKRMIEIYKQAHYMTKHLYLDEQNISRLNHSFPVKPGIKMYYPINWVINMEYMRLFEIDIDKLVEVLENIPSYALADIDKSSVSSSNGPSVGPGGVPKGHGHPETPPDGVVSAQLPAYPKPKENPGGPKIKPPGGRTGGPGYPPGDVGFLRTGPPSVPDELPPSVLSELQPVPQSQSNKSLPSFPNESPLDPEGQSYEAPQSQSYNPPPSFPNESPLDPERQSYEVPQSQPYKSPPSFPNESPLDPERQSYLAPQSQPYDSPPNQPYERPPGQPSLPTEAPVASNVRFGSGDTSFRTEEELKQYYREMYRAKHDGINDKYDNLYR